MKKIKLMIYCTIIIFLVLLTFWYLCFLLPTLLNSSTILMCSSFLIPPLCFLNVYGIKKLIDKINTTKLVVEINKKEEENKKEVKNA